MLEGIFGEEYLIGIIHGGRMPKNNHVGMRHNVGKPKLSFNLLGKESLEAESKVWEFGSTKYARGNWLKGNYITEAADSLARHLVKFMNGEENDDETGLPHTAHIQCCARILNQTFLTKPELDDRESKENDK